MEAISYLSDIKKTSLDVGGLHGMFIVPMLRYSSNVVSFEPVKEKFEHIRKYHKKRSNVSIYNFALSDYEGETEIRTPINKKGEIMYGLSTIEIENNDKNLQYHSEIVRVKRLDDLMIKNVGLVKIDVEGHEISVLNGAVNLFKNELPNVIIESEDRHSKEAPLKVIKFFNELNYKGYFILGREVVSINKFSIKEHQNYSKINTSKPLEEQSYAYNFLFISPKYQIELPDFL